MIDLIILAIMFVGTLAYLYKTEDKRNEVLKGQLRELVIALKSKDVHEYTQAIPEDGELPEQEEDELVDLTEIPPEELATALKKQYGDLKN